MVLRYNEDLISTNPRHPSQIRVRIGCDHDGRIIAAAMHGILDSGAYGGRTPNAAGPHGQVELPSYRVPVFASEAMRIYTNTVPRGHMRAPGSPQGIFALESAMDELAAAAGIDPVEFRRRNLLTTGELDAAERKWAEHRGLMTLDAALAAFTKIEPPKGWLYGRGISVYSRSTPNIGNSSLRLTPEDDGCIRVEIPLIETGTGSHTALRQMICDQLGFTAEQVRVVGLPTSDLPRGLAAGGSRVTSELSMLVEVAAKAWQNRLADEAIEVEINEQVGPDVGSYTVQFAQVAIDPETGQLKVLELLSAVDIAAVINPLAHQMQIDGGSAMGFGQACLEDLDESGGQVWAANLGEYKLPSSRDVPKYQTVLVPGGLGVGGANVKNIGESTTPPALAAIANAVYDATGCRIRELPITAERVFDALHQAAP
jgi:CO/xanthine dehydrogenase Mo-binding subunit